MPHDMYESNPQRLSMSSLDPVTTEARNDLQ